MAAPSPASRFWGKRTTSPRTTTGSGRASSCGTPRPLRVADRTAPASVKRRGEPPNAAKSPGFIVAPVLVITHQDDEIAPASNLLCGRHVALDFQVEREGQAVRDERPVEPLEEGGHACGICRRQVFEVNVQTTEAMGDEPIAGSPREPVLPCGIREQHMCELAIETAFVGVGKYRVNGNSVIATNPQHMDVARRKPRIPIA